MAGPGRAELAGGGHEPFRIGIRARAPGRGLHGLDTGVGQDCVERLGELPGPVADQEPEVRGAVTQIYQKIADLLGGPWAVRVRGDAEDVHVAGADLAHEEAVQALEGHCAVHVEESAASIVAACACRNCRHVVSVHRLAPGDLQRFEDPADRGRADQVAEL
jgi:hypothetical protein